MRFYLVDADGRLIERQARRRLLACDRGDGERAPPRQASGRVGRRRRGRARRGVETDFYGRPVQGRVVDGPWAQALSALAGIPLTLVRADEPGATASTAAQAPRASLVSTAVARRARGGCRCRSSRRRATLPHEHRHRRNRGARGGQLARAAGRRRRGRPSPRGNVGRCRVTSSARRRASSISRRSTSSPSIEPTWRRPSRCRSASGVDVVEPGRVAVGDPVELL